MIIDAHQHFWLLKDRAGAWPPPELTAIYRDFCPADLTPQLERHGIDGTILVQSLPSSAETEALLHLASQHAFILGVVGWADMKAPDAEATIADLAKAPKLKGLRPMLQDIAEDGWIDDPALAPAVEAMIEAGLVFDALVMPRHLPFLENFARRHPALTIVIDHGAKPDIAEGHYRDWFRAMGRLADLENVSCKLSGLLTERGNQLPQAIRPYAETLLMLFGAQRVLFGSDWPVVELAGTYADWFAQARAIVPEADWPRIFGENARQIYGV
ncbi:amidohydrolase family protein [Allorhizobium sp. BGMRC 0089]|uniref:amidohydrolase family protein n=1 Tax=Allorhizobium sonneratiae TaxID=2934936 RepID=UPI0020332CA9|nr:amidohydrolase family protein [Allorhizobium sonneratiae]MCM2292708.1 amidohydrolase family protein [Allorhizobium sonneratiae]